MKRHPLDPLKKIGRVTIDIKDAVLDIVMKRGAGKIYKREIWKKLIRIFHDI